MILGNEIYKYLCMLCIPVHVLPAVNFFHVDISFVLHVLEKKTWLTL